MTDPLFSHDAVNAVLLLALGVFCYGLLILALVSGAAERE
jgi:hypothetical protein